MQSKNLNEIQLYVKKTLTQRGFDNETIEQKLMLLVEEVGELAKAIRKSSGVKIDKSKKQYNIESEIADCLIYLFDISNKLNINIEKAFWHKEEENKKRVWS